MGKKLMFSFDKEGDILDISIGAPKKAISREVKDDFFVRLDPKTKKVVGFSMLNFEKWFKDESDRKIVPINAEFLLARTN